MSEITLSISNLGLLKVTYSLLNLFLLIIEIANPRRILWNCHNLTQIKRNVDGHND